MMRNIKSRKIMFVIINVFQIIIMMLLVVERTSCFNVPTSTLYHRSILRFGWDLLYNDRERLNGISILQSSQNQNSHSRNNRCILSLSHTPQSTNKPTLTGRNKSTNLPKSNRVAIRWVVESIEKVLIQERIERGNKIVQGDTLSKVKATPDEEDELVSIMNQFHTGKIFNIEFLKFLSDYVFLFIYF